MVGVFIVDGPVFFRKAGVGSDGGRGKSGNERVNPVLEDGEADVVPERCRGATGDVCSEGDFGEAEVLCRDGRGHCRCLWDWWSWGTVPFGDWDGLAGEENVGVSVLVRRASLVN